MYCKRSWGISSSSPTGASIKTHAFVCHYSEDTSSSKRFGVCLSLDLKNVEGKKNYFADTNQTIVRQTTFLSNGQSLLTFLQSRA